MELAVSVNIRQLVLHLHCASEFEAPGDPSVFSGKSLFRVPNNMLRLQALAGRPPGVPQPPNHGGRRRGCSDSGDNQANRQASTACRRTGRVHAFLAPLYIPENN